MSFRLGIDIGGTFTDLTLANETTGDVRLYKVPSQPEDPLGAVVEGIGRICDDLQVSDSDLVRSCRRVVHGTTVGTNMIIERNGPKLGFVATKGHRDTLEFMDGSKPNPYDLKMRRPAPFVPRHLRIGVEERVNYRGEELVPLRESDVLSAAEVFRRQNVEAVAVCLLWAPMNPSHEQRVRAIVQAQMPGVPVVLSSDVLPMIREWDRSSATVLSAYVLPTIGAYLGRLRDYFQSRGLGSDLLVIQCNGGCAPVDRILQTPVQILGSGPAAAPAAAAHFESEFAARESIYALSVDMGGTSFDVALLQGGRSTLTRSLEVGGMPLGLVAADVNSVGAGGGSIAWIDSGGALAVGPQSAGARPGPACYGLGGRSPTVTDAAVVLGYISPERFLGGRMQLRSDLAEAAIEEHVAHPLGLTVLQAAAGIFRLTNFKMTKAIAAVSVERGIDPRRYTMVAGGGAGPVHAGKLAEEMGIGRVLIPRHAGGYSAFGMTVTDVIFDYIRTLATDSTRIDLQEVDEVLSSLEAQGRRDLASARVGTQEMILQRLCDASYMGQAHELVVELPNGPYKDINDLRGPFDALHERTFTFCMPNDVVNFFHWRVKAYGPSPFREAVDARADGSDPSSALSGRRRAYFEGSGTRETAVFEGPRLRYGHVVQGPAIIEEATTSVTVFPGHTVRVSGRRNYEYTLPARTQA